LSQNFNQLFILIVFSRYKYSMLLIQSIIFACLIVFTINAQASSADYKLKAAYIYQFTKFAQWPETSFDNNKSPIVICVMGKSPFEKTLDSFSSRSSQNRSLKVEYLAKPENIADCHVVFVGQSLEKNLDNILLKLKNHSVLSVSDIDDFAMRGGIIGFVKKQRRVGIEINVTVSKSSGVMLSSKLLEVSTLVKGHNVEKSP